MIIIKYVWFIYVYINKYKRQKSGTTTTQPMYDTKDKDPFIIMIVWVGLLLKHFKTNLSIITASTSQYAHYVFMAIDRDANGSVSFEVIEKVIKVFFEIYFKMFILLVFEKLGICS